MAGPKRRSNTTVKATRARSRLHGKTRKDARAASQRTRETKNKTLRADGKPTPWMAAKAARAKKRAPMRAAFLKRHPETAGQ